MKIIKNKMKNLKKKNQIQKKARKPKENQEKMKKMEEDLELLDAIGQKKMQKIKNINKN